MASTIGDILREARRGKGETLSDAARQTGVRETHLAALERDELDRLGVDPVYVRGIIRSYAEHLGLDVAGVLHEYPTAIANAAPARSGAATPASRPQTPTGDRDDRHSRSRRRLAAVVGAVLLLVIVVGATALVLNARRGDEVATNGGAQGAQATAPADGASEPSDASEEPTRDSRLLDIPQGNTPDSLTMKLEFTDKVWVRVLVDGETKLEGIMRPGAVTQFTGRRRIDLRLGVAEAVTFSLNGAYYDNIASDRRGPVNVSCSVDASCRVVQEG